MSIVNVFIGQCGNQVGTDFLRSLSLSSSSAYSSSPTDIDSIIQPWNEEDSTFFRSPASSRNSQQQNTNNKSLLPRARAVCIDMEPKVIENCDRLAQDSGLFSLPPANSKSRVTRSSGSGNNWACGYCVHGKQASEDIVEGLRAEAEKAEIFGGFHLVHSVAGGTGSGIGSLTSDLIREHFGGASEIPLNHTVVWPYEHGELSPQWINCALTLSVLDDTADAVHVIANDVATSHLKNAPVFTNRSRVNVSIPWNCVNSWMAREMAALWLPTTRKVPLFDLVSKITNLDIDDDDENDEIVSDDHETSTQRKRREKESSSYSSSPSSSLLPPLTYGDKIMSLCPSKSKIFFESCGSISVLDDPQTSTDLLSMIHQNSSSSSANLSPNRATRSTNAYFTKSELISMLHGNSANSYPEALARTYRSLSSSLLNELKEARKEKNNKQQEYDDDENDGEDDETTTEYLKSSPLIMKRSSDLILCHGATANMIWCNDEDMSLKNMNSPRNRMLQMIVSQGALNTTIGISSSSLAPSKNNGIAFAPLPSLKFCDNNTTSVSINDSSSIDDYHHRQKDSFEKLYSSSALSAYSNNYTFGRRIERAMSHAETLLSTGAFIHHFTQKGLDEADLKEAVIQCYDIASRYGVEV